MSRVSGYTIHLPLQVWRIQARMDRKQNLPSQPTPFIGRVEELAKITGLLGNPDCRLLTLIGPGGIGKTRLALEAAPRRLARHPPRVHLAAAVSLASPRL